MRINSRYFKRPISSKICTFQLLRISWAYSSTYGIPVPLTREFGPGEVKVSCYFLNLKFQYLACCEGLSWFFTISHAVTSVFIEREHVFFALKCYFIHLSSLASSIRNKRQSRESVTALWQLGNNS